MTFEIVLVLAILAGAVACFATERLPVDLVALLVLSAGLVRTGVVSLLGKRLTAVGRLGLRPE